MAPLSVTDGAGRRPSASRGFLLPRNAAAGRSVSVLYPLLPFRNLQGDATGGRRTSPAPSRRTFFRQARHGGGNSFLACISANALRNIASVSITSVKPACISLMVETSAGGPGWSRP